jgi:hypothetical protein
MKTKYFFLVVFLFSFFASFAQDIEAPPKKPDIFAVDLLGFSSPILNRNFFGFSMDVKYYVKQKWGTGINFAATSKKVSTDYAVGAYEPDVTYFSFGWLNQYDFVQRDDVRLGVTLNNGLAIVNLRDRSETEIVYDEFGSTEVPVSKARNFFYTIEPGVTASFRVLKNNNFSDVYVTTQAKYRKVFGNPEFAKTQDFNGYFIGFGVSFIGLMD